MAYFPMFIDLNQKKCLIVGGGSVALRKVHMFQEFGAKIQVIAPDIIEELQQTEGIELIYRRFETSDLQDVDIVVAATDSVTVNQEIAKLCKEQHIPVNVVNAPETGSFVCPAYSKSGDVVAAFSSGGKSPVIPQYLKRQIVPIMSEFLAEQTAYLGSVREMVKFQVTDKRRRKQVYEKLFELSEEKGRLPLQEEFEKIVAEVIDDTCK